MRNWCRKFQADPTLSCLDKQRPGGPRFARCQQKIQQISRLIHDDAWRSIRELAAHTGISIGSVHRIITQDLKLRKIASRFIPKILTDNQKQRHVDATQRNLQRLEDEPLLLRRVVTGDESWVHCYQPNLKQQDMAWVSRQDPRPVKALRARSVKKVMLTTFMDDSACLHHEFTRKSVNRYTYTHILGRLREKVHRKCPGMWAPAAGRQRAMLLLHDNAPAHTALHTRAHLHASGVSLLEHPPYSPNMSPCDYFLFPRLKRELRG